MKSVVSSLTISLFMTGTLLSGCAGDPQEFAESWDGASMVEPGEVQLAASETSDDDLFGYEEEETNDFFETPNRFMFAANETVDVVLIRPAAAGYRFLVPDMAQDSVRSFARNLRTPVILANDLMQGDLDRAETTLARFMINTTAGVGGLFDPATDSGYPYHVEDFGQTLGTHGFGEGTYLVLPILGPSSVRDGVGLVADSLMDPLTYLVSREVRFARFAVEGIDLRARNIENLDELKRDSVDFYARIRSLYRQRRDALINNEDQVELPAPGLSESDEDIQASSLDSTW